MNAWEEQSDAWDGCSLLRRHGEQQRPVNSDFSEVQLINEQIQWINLEISRVFYCFIALGTTLTEHFQAAADGHTSLAMPDLV